MSSAAQSGYAELNGNRFYYESAGSGHPLVLLHGMGWDTRAWDDQFYQFAEKYRTIRYDLRGFGQSGPPPLNRYSHSDDLAGLLKHLGVDSAHVLGHSLGGYVAVDFALTHPGMTDALILADPAVGGYEFSPELVEASFVIPPRLAAEEGVEAARNAWIMFPPFERAMESPATAQRIRQMVEDYSGWHWLHQGLGANLDPPAIQRLGEIASPTLVLIGGANQEDYFKVGDILEKGVRNTKQVIIPGAAHGLPLEKPQLFNQAVMEFLGEFASPQTGQ